MAEYELVIIGAGPGGYPGGLIAGIKGLKTLIVEEEELGGVCLNRGCIPTKFFLKVSQLWEEIKTAREWGIDVSSFQLDFRRVKDNKDRLLISLRSGLEYLLKRRGVNIIKGRGRIISPQEVLISQGKNKNIVKAEKIIIATGSSPVELKTLEFDHTRIFSSDSILDLDFVPPTLLIVGGGVMGVEFAHHFSRLGTKVYLVEVMDRILPQMEPEISRTLETIFKKSGIEIYTSTRVRNVHPLEEGLEVMLENGKNIKVDKILVAVSRKPNTEGLWEDMEIKTEKGFICVDDYLRTDVENIYAIGDVKGGYMLAHAASYEAKIAVANILGENVKPDYSVIPLCIYTQPEIATVGLKEEEAVQKGYELNVARFPFPALSKARIVSQTQGFIKLIADKNTGNILGAHLLGHQVTEIISCLAMAIKFKIPYSQLQELVFPHPTMSEAIQEAICILNGKPVHTI